jgi:hypothetical protein
MRAEYGALIESMLASLKLFLLNQLGHPRRRYTSSGDLHCTRDGCKIGNFKSIDIMLGQLLLTRGYIRELVSL